jgi:hypothetical protein
MSHYPPNPAVQPERCALACADIAHASGTHRSMSAAPLTCPGTLSAGQSSQHGFCHSPPVFPGGSACAPLRCLH